MRNQIMNELVNKFMEEYKAKVEADGQEAAHDFVDAELLPSLTDSMNDEEIKAFQEALVTPVTEYLFALTAAESVEDEVED